VTDGESEMELLIEGYAFGKITLGGRTFTSDLIVFPDGRIRNDWWREQGHVLVPNDISAVLEAAPRILIVGAGASGMMAVSNAVHERCRERGIRVEVYFTSEAVVRYNEIVSPGATVAACFHLTC